MKQYVRDIFYYDFETTQNNFGKLYTVFVNFETKAVLEVWWGDIGDSRMTPFQDGEYRYTINGVTSNWAVVDDVFGSISISYVGEKFEVINRETNRIFIADNRGWLKND